jgi:hypothetical protein
MEQLKVNDNDNVPVLNNNVWSFRSIWEWIIALFRRSLNLLRCNRPRSPIHQGTSVELTNVVEPRPVESHTTDKLPEEKIKKLTKGELVDKIFSDIQMDDKTFQQYLTIRNTHL